VVKDLYKCEYEVPRDLQLIFGRMRSATAVTDIISMEEDNPGRELLPLMSPYRYIQLQTVGSFGAFHIEIIPPGEAGKRRISSLNDKKP
jgi:hypothetical protein